MITLPPDGHVGAEIKWYGKTPFIIIPDPEHYAHTYVVPVFYSYVMTFPAMDDCYQKEMFKEIYKRCLRKWTCHIEDAIVTNLT
jgi:uncharacterized membrane protein